MKKELIKYVFYKAIKYLIYFSGLYFLLHNLFRNKGVYILMYHRIADKADDFYERYFSVKRDEFENQLNFFTKKYSCIGMSEALSILQTNQKLDRNYVVFSFDDGYADNYEYGKSIFNKFNITPIIYVTANKIDKREPKWTEVVEDYISYSNNTLIDLEFDNNKYTLNKKDGKKKEYIFYSKIISELEKMPLTGIYMQLDYLAKRLMIDLKSHTTECDLLSWDNINDLMKSGCEIGSHTMNHVNLTVEPHESVISELYESFELIKEHIYKCPDHFCYPFGKFGNKDDFVTKTVKQKYKSAVTMIEGLNTSGDDPYFLKRVSIVNYYGLIDIKIKLLKIRIKAFIGTNKRDAMGV